MTESGGRGARKGSGGCPRVGFGIREGPGIMRLRSERFEVPNGDTLSASRCKQDHAYMYVHYWRRDLLQVYCYLVLTPVKCNQ